MKKYILPFLILCSFSSCIKVEEESIGCANKPTKPEFPASSYTKNVGETLSITMTNASSQYTYEWYDPQGQLVDAGSNFSQTMSASSMSGQYYAVSKSSQALCVSDKAYFTVTVNEAMPSCAGSMASNTFKLGGSNTLTSGYSSGYEYLDYYNVQYPFGLATLTIDFGKKPSTSGVQVFNVYNTNYPDNLSDNQCGVYFSLSSSYVGTSGQVYTKYSNGTYQIVFCNVNMRSSSGTNYPYSQANLYCSE
jgi:hypothetical protein